MQCVVDEVEFLKERYSHVTLLQYVVDEVVIVQTLLCKKVYLK